MPTAEATPRHPTASKRVLACAAKIERDIVHRALKAGDRYRSADEVGLLFGESVMTAQRAMALLARQRIVERRPRAGTFVGDRANPAAIRCVHLLMPELLLNEGKAHQGYWDYICGLRSALGEVSVQLNFMPRKDVEFVRGLLAQAGVAHSLLGFIVMLPSRSMRAFLNQSGIPTVVAGYVDADLSNLSWLAADQFQIGHLLGAHLIERGHRRLVTMMRDWWSIGEQLIHEGVNEALVAAGLPADALSVQSLPTDRTAIIQIARDRLLAPSDDPPTAFICRTEFQADCVSEAVRATGIRARIDVVVANGPTKVEESRYTCIVPEIENREFGAIAGQMLLELARNETKQPRSQIVGGRLHIVKP